MTSFAENSSTRPVPVEMKLELAIDKDSDNEPQSEDEEWWMDVLIELVMGWVSYLAINCAFVAS